MNKPLLIGICGGTGSGKTSVAREIARAVGDHCVIISQDSYYRDNRDIPYEERVKLNYDHPSAFDFETLTVHLAALERCEPINKPVYSFTTYTRLPQVERVMPAEVILVEGILIFDDPGLRRLFDIKIFVDTDADVRVIRRILRDVQERGRSLQSVCDQYVTSVKPMHEAFIEPSKRYADIILPEGAFNRVGMDIIISKIRLVLAERHRGLSRGTA